MWHSREWRLFGTALLGAAAVVVGCALAPGSQTTEQWEKKDPKTQQHLRGGCHAITAGGTSVFAVGNNGTICRSVDAGANWNATLVQPPRQLNAVSFGSASLGFAVGAGGVIFKTLNGGGGWTKEKESGADLRSVCMASTTRGIAVGARGTYWVYNNAWSAIVESSPREYWGVVARPSTDSGAGWEAWGTGESSAGSGTGFVRRFNGASWTANLPMPIVPPPLRGVYFLDKDLGWVVGDQNTVLKTTNGGDAWVEAGRPGNPSGSPESLASVSFVDAYRGWVVTDRGKIYETQDGGSNWTENANPAGSTALRFVWMQDGTRGWAAGDAGTLLMYK